MVLLPVLFTLILLLNHLISDVVQSLSCVQLCDPMDCSTSGFPVLCHLLGVCSNSYPLNQWCYPNISSSVTPFSCPQSFPASGCFPMSQLFASGSQSTEASALASVLSMNIQGSLRSPKNQELQTLFRSECPTTWRLQVFYILLSQLVQEAVFHLCLLEAQPSVVPCMWWGGRVWRKGHLPCEFLKPLRDFAIKASGRDLI